MTGTPIYAIGDIHGQFDQMNRALDLIARDGGAEAEIVFLGDLVDRGPDSRAVIDSLIRGQETGRNWHVLKGNHDRMFARFLRDATVDDERISSALTWLHPRLGGDATLASYGVEVAETDQPADLHRQARDSIPQVHLTFLTRMPLYLERGELLFVHAGIVPGVALAEQSEDDLLWIRKPFLEFTGRHPWLVVHGHTALEMPHHFGNRVDLDGGAGHGRQLHPAVFEGRDCWLLTEGGRIRLAP
ncbi:metallophosphoesterase [Sedimentitalea arenosa]|uniref:Serine/threonine protein phosphatase n=1 Tax=Sedimentitalea arenosa TaxID=2798803 RepID=A0A8J7LZS7_9RHOB|nr:metallophosphoesterase [Arenibacterium arenosum]MBJ6372101.1 serine/threonine protein phosphatase [Arenibacterium arenosum]